MIELITGNEIKDALLSDKLCKEIGAALTKAYPGRRWYVEVVDRGRIGYIKMPSISMEYGIAVHLSGTPAENIKKCILAAGELQERFRLTRGKTDNNDVYQLPRDHKGVIGAAKGEL